MPAKTHPVSREVTARLIAQGERIRAHRKTLRISATATAEAAGISRVTLHRIESGEGSVTIGAYLNVLDALALDFSVEARTQQQPALPAARDTKGWIPARVRIDDYPQLKRLAWQVHAESLTPLEAFGIYQRNGRHLDDEALTQPERDLIDALRVALGEGRTDV